MNSKHSRHYHEISGQTYHTVIPAQAGIQRGEGLGIVIFIPLMWPSQCHGDYHEISGQTYHTVIPAQAGIQRGQGLGIAIFIPLMWPSQGHGDFRESGNTVGHSHKVMGIQLSHDERG